MELGHEGGEKKPVPPPPVRVLQLAKIASDPPPVPRAAATPPVVTLHGVAKRFASGTLALDQLDLAIRHGEFVSLLGPSGCGKSTALRLIAGLAEPTRGSISWGGTPLPRSPPPTLPRTRGLLGAGLRGRSWIG